jgi:hypothetical protein
VSWPTFLIIGAHKAGTTALYSYLAQHPEIFMSSVKEPAFFSYEGQPDPDVPQQVTAIEDYKLLFADSHGAKALGEASTPYLCVPGTAERIHKYVPNAKLLAVLRDPSYRAYSNYLYLRQYGREHIRSFADAIAEEPRRIAHGWRCEWHYTSLGFYYQQLSRYFELFARDQIKIILYEDFKRDPRSIMQQVYSFLDVDKKFAVDVSARHNVTLGLPDPRMDAVNTLVRKQLLPRWIKKNIPNKQQLWQIWVRVLTRHRVAAPELDPAIHRRLIELYREDISKLECLIDRDLSAWLTTSSRE